MTAEALKEKMEKAAAKEAPVLGIEAYPLLDSPEFKDLCERKIALDAQKKAAEKGLAEIGPEIEAMLTASEAERVGYRDGYVVKIGKGRGPDRIDATKLVEQGVSLEIVAKATVEGKGYTFAQIVPPAPAKGGGK